MMVETIMTALLGGLAAISGKVATKAIEDAYRALKSLLVRKLGDNSEAAEAITKLEAKPESVGRKATVAEEIKATKVGEDPELVEAARRLQEAIEQLPPRVRAHIQRAVGNYIAQASGGSTAKVNAGMESGKDVQNIPGGDTAKKGDTFESLRNSTIVNRSTLEGHIEYSRDLLKNISKFAAPRKLDNNVISETLPVDASVFSPSNINPGNKFLVQVFLYASGAEDVVISQAKEVDQDAKRRGTYSIPLDVPLNTRVDLRLEMDNLEVKEADAVLIWRGRPTASQFEVTVPAIISEAEVIGRVRFAVAGIPAGTLRFKIGIGASDVAAAPITPCEAKVERYHRAFVSYSSQDRAEVLRRVQAFRIAGLSVFQDILDLEPGDRWARALYREIDNCDVFLLFWSKAAAASEWVAKEIAYALERKAGSDDKPPAIQPVPIEGPPPPSPPEVLRHLHFNDALLAHIQAATASAKPAGKEGP
jgi:hypothetical protein